MSCFISECTSLITERLPMTNPLIEVMCGPRKLTPPFSPLFFPSPLPSLPSHLSPLFISPHLTFYFLSPVTFNLFSPGYVLFFPSLPLSSPSLPSSPVTCPPNHRLNHNLRFLRSPQVFCLNLEVRGSEGKGGGERGATLEAILFMLGKSGALCVRNGVRIATC